MAGYSSDMFGWSWTEVSECLGQSGIWTRLNGGLCLAYSLYSKIISGHSGGVSRGRVFD